MATSFDFLICGGGHVGSCLALALAEENFRVAYVDRLSVQERKNTEDNRIFALAKKTRDILEALQVWSLLHPYATPIQHIHVSNKGTFGAARLHAKDFQQDALGYMVSSFHLQESLNVAVAKTHVTIFSPATLSNIHIDKHGVSATISETGEMIEASCLIGTDGVDSLVRQHVGIGLTKKDYQQKALVTIIDLEHSHHFTAYERFVDQTAIALLPHTPWQSVLIWSGDNAFIDRLISLDDQLFLQELQQAFGYRLGRFSSLSKRISYPLAETQADKVHADRVLLMGNAAQTLHPMGAQGFNLALRNVGLFISLLKEAKLNQEEPLHTSLFERYAQQQEKDTIKTMHFTHHLVSASSNSGMLNRMMRVLAINALGTSSWIQKYILEDK